MQVPFERLEYGKLCKSTDGPIEPGVESYPLAASPGFPPRVEPLCRPWLVGVGAEVVSDAPAGHGTVLRCVRIEGRPVQLFCRLRQRPEGGEGVEGRRFWLGRYAVTAETVDPLTGFTALEMQKLRGITVAETREPWPQIAVPRSPRPEPDSLFAPVLQAALEHVLSGLPVGVSQAPDERSFFQWASLLWHLLPPALQPVFSAGWAVTPEVAQTLNFSWSPGRSPVVTRIDVERREVLSPERVELARPDGEIRARPFQEDLLVPGRMFLRESFEWLGGQARLEGASPRLDHLAGFDFAIRGNREEPASAVDLRSLWAWERFRRPGGGSLDYARLRLAETWLETGKGEPSALSLSTRDYFFPDSKKRLFDLGVHALQVPEQQRRAEQIVWRSLTEDPGCREAIDENRLPEREAPRVRLLQALADEDIRRVLEALESAQAVGSVADLPPAAMDRLWEALSGSLNDPAWLGFHRNFLGDAAVIEPYKSWAAESSPALAVLLGTEPDLACSFALDQLERISGHPIIGVMSRLQKNEPPTPSDLQALGALDPKVVEQLAGRLIRRWQIIDGETKSRREGLAAWLTAVGPHEFDDPLLVLLNVGPERLAPLKRDLIPLLAEEILQDRVPPSLQEGVAALVLEEWHQFREDYEKRGIKKAAGWTAVFKNWPPAAILALVGEKDIAPRDTPLKVQAVLGRLSLPGPLLTGCIQTHLGRRKSKLHTETAALLWNWCRRARKYPGEPTAADVCGCLARGEFPAEEPAPPPETVLREAARFARQIPISLPPRLWNLAVKGWQVLLALEAAPQCDLKPTKDQLEALIHFRTRLKEHLKDKDIHSERRALFEIATLSFHQVSFQEAQWQSWYEETPFWAAFMAVPLNRQGNLKIALDAYSEAGQKSRVDNATKYFLHSYAKTLSREEQASVLLRVAHAVILPLLGKGGLSAAYAELLITAPAQGKSQGRVTVKVEKDSGSAVEFRDRDNQIVVASWFKRFLDEINARSGEDKLIAAIKQAEG